MAKFVCEVMSLYHLLQEMGLKTSVPSVLWCDNQTTLHITSNPMFHKSIKHIEIDCHFVHEKIHHNLISANYVKIGEQLGDIFSKAHIGVWIDYICNKLGMIDIYAPT